MKTNKIFPILFAVSLPLFGKGYLGGEMGMTLWNTQVEVKGVDAVSDGFGGTIPYGFSQTYGFKNAACAMGVLVGYSFQTLKALAPFIEVNYTYLNRKKTRDRLRYYNDAHGADGDLRDELVAINPKQALGFMPGLDVEIAEKVWGVLGARFTVTQYDVQAVDRTNSPQSAVQKKAFIWGVEPTVGLKCTLAKAVSGRFTVGYQLGQNKRVINNYVNNQALSGNGVRATVYVKPRGLVMRVAILYMF